MGRIVIETWARKKLSEKFSWGTNDCNWIMCEWLEIVGLWKPPSDLMVHKGTFSDWKGANKVVQQLPHSVKWYIEDAGFRVVDDKPQQGDLVEVEVKSRAYNLYLPVIYGQTVLTYQLKDNKIILKSLSELNRDFIVYRKV